MSYHIRVFSDREMLAARHALLQQYKEADISRRNVVANIDHVPIELRPIIHDRSLELDSKMLDLKRLINRFLA